MMWECHGSDPDADDVQEPHSEAERHMRTQADDETPDSSRSHAAGIPAGGGGMARARLIARVAGKSLERSDLSDDDGSRQNEGRREHRRRSALAMRSAAPLHLDELSFASVVLRSLASFLRTASSLCLVARLPACIGMLLHAVTAYLEVTGAARFKPLAVGTQLFLAMPALSNVIVIAIEVITFTIDGLAYAALDVAQLV